jgi:hypothetical protein
MSDLDRIRGVKRGASARLHALPGVHSVGVGGKLVEGKDTGELAIVVFVEKKKKREELSEGQLVPSQIEGIKTDVVESPRVRLLNADPNSISVTITPPAPGTTGGNVTLSGTPEDGLRVVIDLTVQESGHDPIKQVAFAKTVDKITLADIAGQLQKSLLKILGVNATLSTVVPNQVVITGQPGYTVAITNPGKFVIAIDQTKYFKDWVRGGITIASPSVDGFATLGCLATTDPTEHDPEGTVVGLTNFHTVCPIGDKATNLRATVHHPDDVVVDFQTPLLNGNPFPVVNDTYVMLLINDIPEPKNLLYSAFYATAPGDAPAKVVSGILAAATGLPNGISLSKTSDNPPTITLTGPATLDCKTFALPKTDPKAKLTARVLKPTVTENDLSFEGVAATGDYGIYVKINPGGVKFTFGTFTNPQKGQNSNDIAQAVSAAFSRLPASLLGDVTAVPTDNVVRINNAQYVECRIVSDIRVGQPDADFGSTCSDCCSDRIGRVVDAQIHSDAALIQLDPKLNYKMEIQDITGGIRANTAALIKGLPVKKRGRTTGTTTGKVSYVEVSTDLEEDNGLFRLVENAFLIESDTADPFNLPGDSGSAVLSSADNTLVGLLFGARNTDGIACELGPLLNAFPKLSLSFAPAPGDDPDMLQTVPVPPPFDSAERGLSTNPGTPQVAFAGTKLSQRLDQAESEIRQTVLGKEYIGVVRRHMEEGFALVNHNRRVATVWRRSGGPEILEALARIVQFRNERLPAEISGRPFAESMNRIQQIFTRYASPAFSADLNRYAPKLKNFGNMTYLELVAAFQSEAME